MGTPVIAGAGDQQCAALGVVHIGGLNDSHHFLWWETATNDWKILETKIMSCLNDMDYRIKLIKNAWKKLNEIYSYNAVRKRFNEVVK